MLNFLRIFISSILLISYSCYGANSKMDFWDTRKKGANIFNRDISLEDIKVAKRYGIEFIRLAPDKFLSSRRDFLLGSADNYTGLVKEDLQRLKQILDMFYSEKIYVIICMLSLPGSRWKQNNASKDDLRIWKDEKFKKQAADFWKDLAFELKSHPAIVGYDILNEPHPEKLPISNSTDMQSIDRESVAKILYEFYDLIIESIRSSDRDTPIIIESPVYADPRAFEMLKTHKDNQVIYSFHMYEPYEYTNRKSNNDRYSYPGIIAGKEWNRQELKQYLSSVVKFQKLNNIPSTRILVGEFGGHRMSAGLEKYFQDLISIFTEEGWHFAFYAFREDTWDGMDYELGSRKLPFTYWQSIERGRKIDLDRKDTHSIFRVIKNSLNKT